MFGTVVEDVIYLLIDTSLSMQHHMTFVKDKIFLLFQVQFSDYVTHHHHHHRHHHHHQQQQQQQQHCRRNFVKIFTSPKSPPRVAQIRYLAVL